LAPGAANEIVLPGSQQATAAAESSIPREIARLRNRLLKESVTYKEEHIGMMLPSLLRPRI